MSAQDREQADRDLAALAQLSAPPEAELATSPLPSPFMAVPNIYALPPIAPTAAAAPLPPVEELLLPPELDGSYLLAVSAPPSPTALFDDIDILLAEWTGAAAREMRRQAPDEWAAAATLERMGTDENDNEQLCALQQHYR